MRRTQIHVHKESEQVGYSASTSIPPSNSSLTSSSSSSASSASPASSSSSSSSLRSLCHVLTCATSGLALSAFSLSLLSSSFKRYYHVFPRPRLLCFLVVNGILLYGIKQSLFFVLRQPLSTWSDTRQQT